MIGSFVFAMALGSQASPPVPQAAINASAAKDSQGLPVAPAVGDKVAVMDTSKGKIVIMFLPTKAPMHVANFLDLAEKKFYDGTRFHRCIPGFMVQGGDPNSADLGKAGLWGTGGFMVDGKERNVDAEFNDVKHLRGIVSMARSSGPNSASSQFFIMHAAYPSLDGLYSAFGKVIEGMDVVDEIVKTGEASGKVDPGSAVVIKSVTVKTFPVTGTILAPAVVPLATQQSFTTDPKPDEEVAVFRTDAGSFTLMFYPEVAPKTVANFKALVKEGFYDGTRFHRCIPGFVIQGGDPNSKDATKYKDWGEGGHIVNGKEQTIPGEFGKVLRHWRGVLSMARSEDVNSASSQFFVCTADVFRLDGRYAAFGRVVEGMDTVDKIVATGPTEKKKNGQVPKWKAVLVRFARLMPWKDAHKG